jgi:hypothetical protein
METRSEPLNTDGAAPGKQVRHADVDRLAWSDYTRAGERVSKRGALSRGPPARSSERDALYMDT